MKFMKKVVLLCLLALGAQPVHASEWIYTFRPGDTLWDLCEKYIAARDCWEKVAERNQVKTPRNIKPGTRLYLPISWLKVLPASATVLSTRGNVYLKRADSKERVVLSGGAEILVGDTITTDEGTATLQFADESILIVTPGSEVEFDTLTLYGESGMVDTRVRLNRGRARAKVRPTEGPASRYEILTPAAVAAVRGTDFRVVSEDKDPPEMRTEVLEGNVAVANDAGAQNLAQGYALKAVSGQSPESPVKLLGAPVLISEMPETLSAFPWELRWQAIKGAVAYRLQLYREGLIFDDLLLEQKLSVARYNIPKLPEGNYKTLVSAIDGDGFQGMEAAYRMTVVAPQEIKPPEVTVSIGEENGVRSLHWQWDAIEGVKHYRVAVSADQQQPAGEQQKHFEVMDNQFIQGISEPGIYRLKVAPVVGEQTLAFSDEAMIRVRDENAPPVWVQAIVGITLLIIIF